ncbi:MAG TPA: complex I NDUFA9 subunit family protein [Gaiellales bacterium]|nr:complex I NDUFA9 subunit family protein [Gaiellales bacterium]
MRVLVTGGTGYVGAEVVASLVSAGHEVRALVHRAAPHLPDGVEQVNGDVADADSYRNAAEGTDAIVHLVAILDGTDEQFEAINAGGARNAVAAAKANGIGRIVHMSALGVTAQHAPLTRYWRTKYAGKTAVMESGLEWTVIEPSFVFGRNGGALKAFESLIRLPVTPVIGDGTYRHQPVWVGDVATAFVRALERPETAGQVIPLGGPQAFTFDELLDELARVTGRAPRRKLHAPAGLVKAQTPVLSHLPPPLKVTRDQIVMLLEGTECDIGPMRTLLGIEPASIAEAYTR